MGKKLFIFLMILLVPSVYAAHGEMPLLAVRETPERLEGSTARLILDISPGKGRVFLETIPLSKLDAQISTRFAKDIACDFLDKECESYDFFYTIKSDSSIVGGPSAGAAIAVLTASLLEGIKIDNDIAITGTINSGGLIGPVGGLKEKIDAAASIGIKKIIIPKGESVITDEENRTIDLKEYSKTKGIQLLEAADLNEAIYLFSGKLIKEEKGELVVDEAYLNVMSGLAVKLCNRSNELKREIEGLDEYKIDNETVLAEEEAANMTKKGKDAFEQGRYYSSASYCFGANTRYRFLILRNLKGFDFEALKEELEEYERKIDKLEIRTITDLEAYMIIKERIREAAELLDKSIEKYNKDDESYINDVAYAIERLYTAHSWAEFIGVRGKAFIFNRESLKESCTKKISEAEERYEYTKLLLQEELVGTKKEIDYAKEDFDNGDYELCLFRASKAKAEADTILGMIGVEEEQIENVLNNRLKIIKDNIIEQQEKGVFPILGYSYYEYAGSLKDEKYSALLYSGYALELSNIDMYFKEETKGFEISIISELGRKDTEDKTIIAVIFALIIGFLIGLKIGNYKKRHKSYLIS